MIPFTLIETRRIQRHAPWLHDWELKCFSCGALASNLNKVQVGPCTVNICLCPACQENGGLDRVMEREFHAKNRA